MSFTARSQRVVHLVLISFLVVSCAEASAAEAPIALAPVGVTINTNTPPPTPRVSPTLRPATQPPTRTLVPTSRPTNTLAPIGRPPARPAVQAVAPTLTFTAAPQVARSGTIREIEVESDVLSKLNANASEGAASLGQKITSGGTVRTLDRGKARIDLNEGTIVRIAPKTLFTVTDLNQDMLNPFTRLQLAFGKVFIILSGGRMEVETPIGSASVRGSFMSVEFNAALRQLTINCLETAFNCDLSYQGTIFNLLTLQKMIVPPHPPQIQPMTGADLKDWLINVPNSSNVIPPTNTPPPPPPAAPVTGGTATGIVVTTLTDELNNDGDCSLREAIRAANTNLQVDQCVPAGGSDTITFSVSGIIPMAVAGTGEDAALTGDYDITESLTIIGNGAANTTISGNSMDRAFHIFAGTVSLSEMTISNGNPGAAQGGGVYVGGGSAALSNVTVLNNTSLEGGGVYINAATLTISGSTIKGNTATNSGGGIFANTGTTLTIYSGIIGGSSATDKNTATSGGGIYAKGTTSISNGAVIQKNEATSHGGGIYNIGTLTMSGSTISGNIADSDNNGTGNGGGLWNNSTATLTTSTVSSNSAQDGGGISNDSTLTLDRTTVSSNNAKNNGGGLINVSTITVVNSTFSGNVSDSDTNGVGEGGGIAHGSGTANLSFVTITNNNAASPGGVGGLKHVGSITVKNSIISDQAASRANCGGAGTLTASGSNYASDASCSGFTNSGAGVLLSTTLGGGPPAYHLLAGSSPAKDSIFLVACTTIAGSSASPAQNGQTRPVNPNCDAGAVEMP